MNDNLQKLNDQWIILTFGLTYFFITMLSPFSDRANEATLKERESAIKIDSLKKENDSLKILLKKADNWINEVEKDWHP